MEETVDRREKRDEGSVRRWGGKVQQAAILAAIWTGNKEEVPPSKGNSIDEKKGNWRH